MTTTNSRPTSITSPALHPSVLAFQRRVRELKRIPHFFWVLTKGFIATSLAVALGLITLGLFVQIAIVNPVLAAAIAVGFYLYIRSL